eukprot:scaffold6499_cov59-Isochrysis_galbana.AAC.1
MPDAGGARAAAPVGRAAHTLAQARLCLRGKSPPTQTPELRRHSSPPKPNPSHTYLRLKRAHPPVCQRERPQPQLIAPAHTPHLHQVPPSQGAHPPVCQRRRAHRGARLPFPNRGTRFGPPGVCAH